MTIDVTVNEIPAGRSFSGFSYQLNYDSQRIQVTGSLHNSATANVLASAPGSSVSDLSAPLPSSGGKFLVSVADFQAAEAGPQKGVLGRYTLSIPSSAPLGTASLTLSQVDLGDPMASAIPVGLVTNASIQVGGTWRYSFGRMRA